MRCGLWIEMMEGSCDGSRITRHGYPTSPRRTTDPKMLLCTQLTDLVAFDADAR